VYERRHAPLISGRQFARRMAMHVLAAIALVLVSLGVGMVGFHSTERTFSWIDSYLNAAMLLGGMGQVDAPHTWAGKFFAGTYALYAGLLVIFVTGLLLAPLLHRLMHRFHWTEQGERPK
jgi:hypothetical protein